MEKMKRNVIVAFLAAIFFTGCVKEPQYIVFPHQGTEGEPYSTSLFVATDRHEAGGGNNLAAMLQLMAANQQVVMPQMVLLGGDYVGRGPDHGTTGQPAFSVEDIRSEVFRIMDPAKTELLLTYGSHDRGCTDGYSAFFSGPHRCDGYYVYGISYVQMVFATDSSAQAAIDLYLEQGDDTTSTPPPTATVGQHHGRHRATQTPRPEGLQRHRRCRPLRHIGRDGHTPLHGMGQLARRRCPDCGHEPRAHPCQPWRQ